MKAKSNIGIICLSLATLLLASCSTIVSKSSYPVTINSNPSGARVKIANNRGEIIHTAVTPTTVTLKASAGYFKPASYTMTFTMDGYPTRTVPLKATINGWYAGNIVFGGLLGILIVDPASGAMWHLDGHVTADMGGRTLSSTTGTQSLRVVERSAIPAEWEGHLVAINPL